MSDKRSDSDDEKLISFISIIPHTCTEVEVYTRWCNDVGIATQV
jgi:hypothetical protein